MAAELITMEYRCPSPSERIAGCQCPICGGIGAMIGSKNTMPLRECRDGHAPIMLSWQWASEAEYESLYSTPGRYHNDLMLSAGQLTSIERDDEYQQAAKERISWIAMLTDCVTGTLLDVGAGAGAFVAVANEFGYHADGIEPDAGLAAWAASQGRNVSAGKWESVRGEWDFITLHDVWEHLTRPVACLQHLKRCLAPGGMIVVEIPDYMSRHHKSEGWAWRHIKPDQHIFLPSFNAAVELFEMAGLTFFASVAPKRGSLGKMAYYLTPSV